jgi:hypothetical protein
MSEFLLVFSLAAYALHIRYTYMLAQVLALIKEKDLFECKKVVTLYLII